MTLDSFDSVAWLILGIGVLTAVSTPYWPMLLGPRFPKHIIWHAFAASAIYFGYRGKSLITCIFLIPAIFLSVSFLRDQQEENGRRPRL